MQPTKRPRSLTIGAKPSTHTVGSGGGGGSGGSAAGASSFASAARRRLRDKRLAKQARCAGVVVDREDEFARRLVDPRAAAEHLVEGDRAGNVLEKRDVANRAAHPRRC